MVALVCWSSSFRFLCFLSFLQLGAFCHSLAVPSPDEKDSSEVGGGEVGRRAATKVYLVESLRVETRGHE